MSKLFRGGIPYAVDVKRLNEAFPGSTLFEGRVITHSQLEEIVTSPKGTPRYYQVINSWIGQAKTTHGIFIVWKQGTGVEVLDPANLLLHAGHRTRQKIRQTGRAVNIYGFVDRQRLNTSGQQLFDHHKRVLGVFSDAMRAAKKELPIVLEPIQSLPKPKIDATQQQLTPKPETRKETTNENGTDRIN